MNNETINFEEYIYELCDEFPIQASIDYHIEKPIIAQGFEYGMEEQYDNEMSISFPIEFNAIEEFLNILNEEQANNKNCYWIEHYSDELMTDYDHLYIWWKN